MKSTIIIEEKEIITKITIIKPNTTFNFLEIRKIIDEKESLANQLSMEYNIIDLINTKKLVSQKVSIREELDEPKTTLIIESIIDD